MSVNLPPDDADGLPPTAAPSALLHNPFATRFTQPGALAYQFDGPTTSETLVERLAGFHWRAQIVGPHGSGKSTLLKTLRPYLIDRGRELIEVSLHSAHRQLPPLNPPSWTSATLIVVDGYEQLHWLARWWLRRAVGRRDAGLLVTTHKAQGLPTLWNTSVSLDQAQALIRHLLVQQQLDPGLMAHDVAELWPQHGDNFREMLFELYDRMVRRRDAAGVLEKGLK